MPTNNISDDEYRAAFIEDKTTTSESIHSKALERALDIRKFEIELY